MAEPNLVKAQGVDPVAWQRVTDLQDQLCADGLLPACALFVARGGQTFGQHFSGRQSPAADSPPLRDDAIFLIASITKPVVVMAILKLVEEAHFTLNDRVADLVPEFGRNGKYAITIRHLLTHTSGLPDMLPNNRELRASHQPLEAFIEETCGIATDFPAGRSVQYQSMGIAMLADIIRRVTGRTCSQYLQDAFFGPLDMHDTALGAPNTWFEGSNPKADRIAQIRVPEEQQDTDWGWNSRYWLQFGAPWGGLLTTPSDLAKFAQAMLEGGAFGSVRILSTSSIAAATQNQLQAFADIPEPERRTRPWGFGWRLSWPTHSSSFGDLVGPRTYGHWGATGTMLWIDPDQQLFTILFSTEPHKTSGRHLIRLSNAIVAAAH